MRIKNITKYATFSAVFILSLGLFLGVANINATAAPQLLAQDAETDEVQITEEPEDNCIALQEVTTGETEVRKRIENRVISSGNWNTDFLVPTDQDFDYFVALLTPENNATYELTINLRFPDNTSLAAYSNRAEVTAGETYAVPFQSSTKQQPIRVNARVGGVNGNVYTIAIAACANE